MTSIRGEIIAEMIKYGLTIFSDRASLVAVLGEEIANEIIKIREEIVE